MTVHGSSNVRDWSMDVQQLSGTVEVDTAARDSLSIEQVQVQVPVEQIVTDRSSMQEKAHKALKKNAYPTIYFQSDEVKTTPAAQDSFSVTATGELIIAGERQTIDLTATGAPQGNGTYSLTGEHELQLSTYDVERPTALLGALRVSDDIRLSFDVVIAPK